MRSVAAWLLVAPAVAWAVMRLGGLERGYPLVPLAAFTPYAAALAVVAALGALALRRRPAALVGALAAAALLAAVVPRAAGGRLDKEGTAGTSVRILSANVLGGSVPAPRLVALARRERADVLAVQELTPELDAGLRRAFPHRVADPRPGAAGTGLYSAFPLERIPSPPGTAAATPAAIAREPSGLRFTVLSVHPTAPVRGSIGRWRRDLRALPSASRPGPPLVLAGDFNATLDHAELRRLLGTGYEDAAAHVGLGLKTTWRRGRRFPPPVAIDHVLAERPIEAYRVEIRDLPPSDHRAVMAELILPGRERAR